MGERDLVPTNRQKTGKSKKGQFAHGTLDPRETGKATQFGPGNNANPTGRPKIKPMVQAMKEVLKENPELLKDIVTNALHQALEDPRYFKEVRDMLDGRPPVAIVGGDGGPVEINATDARDKLLADLASE